MPADVLQKLLMPWISGGILDQGYYHLGGPVVRAADVVDLGPAAMVAAYGLAGEPSPFGAGPEFVDVLRFPVHPLMELRRPEPRGPRPWPTYENGFLPGGDVVPVWLVTRTRVPAGAELWRIPADGEQRLLAVYDSPALGWRGARGYYPPVHMVGTRAQWHGLDLPAEISADGAWVELVHSGERAPAAPGFTQARPQVWRCVVPRAEVDKVFDLTLTCTWRGAPCRIIQHTPSQTRLLLLTDDPAATSALNGEEVEPGIYETTAPSAELQNVHGATRDLATAA